MPPCAQNTMIERRLFVGWSAPHADVAVRPLAATREHRHMDGLRSHRISPLSGPKLDAYGEVLSKTKVIDCCGASRVHCAWSSTALSKSAVSKSIPLNTGDTTHRAAQAS